MGFEERRQQGLCKTSTLIKPSWHQVMPVGFGGIGMAHTFQQAVRPVGELLVAEEEVELGRPGLHQQNAVGVQAF